MRLLLILLSLVSSLSMDAQKKNSRQREFFLMYDDKWQPASVEKASYMAYVKKWNDTMWVWKYYNVFGPLLNIETFRDEDATIPHGFFAYYDKEGRIDSSGYTIRGKKDGNWIYYDDTLGIPLMQVFEMGRLKKEYGYMRTGSNVNDDMPDPTAFEATYPGGNKEWAKYISKNFTVPERGARAKISGNLIVGFIVEADGQITDPVINKSLEFSIDEAALELILESKKWEPAIQNGKNIRAFRRQPISVVLR